jgi:hypothetical protein
MGLKKKCGCQLKCGCDRVNACFSWNGDCLKQLRSNIGTIKAAAAAASAGAAKSSSHTSFNKLYYCTDSSVSQWVSTTLENVWLKKVWLR